MMFKTISSTLYLLISTFIITISSQDQPNPLSIGGQYIQHGESPWLCPLYQKLSRSDSTYLCGSSLVTSQYVVTAAHCVREKLSSSQIVASTLFIFAGIYDLDDQNDSAVQVHHVQQLKIHPKWNVSSQRFDADIALVRLKDVVEFTQFVQRIQLPTKSHVLNSLNGLVVGYGRSENQNIHENRPRRIQIPVVDAEACYQNHEIFSQIKSREAFCAGKKDVIPCNGDSGSSFYVLDNSSPVLVGIVSSGIVTSTGQCRNDAYVLFTDVFKFVDWIIREVGSGYLLGMEDRVSKPSTEWKSNDALCEFVADDGYRCSLRGVRSSASDVKITNIAGQHQSSRDDDDVVKVWIIEQEAKFIPEMSDVVDKFKRISDLRIWTCGLKYVERSKLKIFAKRLQKLDFFNNHIEEIPADAFEDLTQLNELKLLNNRIKFLPENLLKNLGNLKWFFADFNEIEELPVGLFSPTSEIVEIHLKNNWLRRILVDFRKLRSVNVIDLSQNSCIDKCLGHYCSKISVDEMQREIQGKCS